MTLTPNLKERLTELKKNLKQTPEWNKEAYKTYKREYRLKKKELNRKCLKTTCKKCGIHQDTLSRTLELHHKAPLRDPSGNGIHNTPGNLDTLCHGCHQQWHRLYEGLMDYDQWLITTTGDEVGCGWNKRQVRDYQMTLLPT